MFDRLHPLVYATAGLCCLSLLAVAARVWLGSIGGAMPWDPWYTTYVDAFFNGAGRAIVALFGVSAAAVNLFRHDGAEYRVAVWGWGAIAGAALVALIMHSISNTLAPLFGF